MINEFIHFLTRSDNVYFANTEEVSSAVFTAVFCFTHVKHHLIKCKPNNNWSAQVLNSVLCEIEEANQICSPLKISQSINPESACDRNNKSMYSCFYERKKFRNWLMYWEERNRI